MPYLNEHSARLKDPGDFDKDTFRRKNDGTIFGKVKVPGTVAVIWAKLKTANKAADYPVPQALRFSTKNWTAATAKKWLKDNNVSYQKFERAAAAAGTKQAEPKYNCECIKCGYKLKSDQHCAESKCPKCGGQMRREERPGPGQAADQVAEEFREVPASALWFREAEAEATVGDDDRFRLRVYSGKPVDHWLFGKVIIDLATLSFKAKLPVLLEHERSARVGWSDKTTADDQIVCEGPLMKSTAASQEIRETRAEGYPWEASAGFGAPGRIESLSEGTTATVNGQSVEGPIEIWRDVQLREASFVTLGVDQDTGLAAGDSANTVQVPCPIPFSEGDVMADDTGRDDQGQADDGTRQEGQTLELQRFKDLKAAFADDPTFAAEQFEANASVDEAKAAYADVVKAKLKASEAANVDLAAKLEAAEQAKDAGVPGVPGDGAGGDEGEQDFMEVARGLAEDKSISMTAAMRLVARKNPDLHREFKAAARAAV